MKKHKENKKKIILTTITGIIATVAFLTLMLILTVYTEAISIPTKVFIIIVAVAIFLAGIYFAIQ